jgi:hypothetical protein
MHTPRTSDLWREGRINGGAKRAIKGETQSISTDYQFWVPLLVAIKKTFL